MSAACHVPRRTAAGEPWHLSGLHKAGSSGGDKVQVTKNSLYIYYRVGTEGRFLEK